MHKNLEANARKTELLAEAIACQKMVQATYNGARLEFSPHQLFVRNGSIYVAAYNASKSRRHDEDPKLGGYNLNGLSEISLIGSRFDLLPTFRGAAMRAGDEVLVNVEAL